MVNFLKYKKEFFKKGEGCGRFFYYVKCGVVGYAGGCRRLAVF